MHRINPLKALCWLLIPFVFTALACDRNDTVWDGEIVTTVDHSFVSSEFAAIGNLIDFQARSDSTLLGEFPSSSGFYCPGATVTITNTGTASATVQIDFGAGRNCLDGRNRAGKLVAEFNGLWKNPGSTVVTTPDGYSVEGYAFFFIHTTTINPNDAQGRVNWTTVVSDAELINPADGSTINWEGTRTTTWVEGAGTFGLDDNVYEITGSATGVARSLRSFTAATTSPLRVELTCPTPVSGTYTISPDSLQTRTIDYGVGACDNVAVLRINEFETQINLR